MSERAKNMRNSLGETVPVIWVCCKCRGPGSLQTAHSVRECPDCKGSGYGRC